jgi:hypothetical protein
MGPSCEEKNTLDKHRCMLPAAVVHNTADHPQIRKSNTGSPRMANTYERHKKI